MAATYRFRIMTPAKTVLDAQVVSLIAPGGAGYLGVLANHAPLVTTLRSGTLTVRLEDAEKLYRVEGGILRVANNSAMLLSERVDEVSA
jgi:F-type H+-transporting ATPase subunit epsilon